MNIKVNTETNKFKKYFNQEHCLDEKTKKKLKELDQKILYFALADLDEADKIYHSWIILSHDYLTISNSKEFKTIELKEIIEVKEKENLSSTCWFLLRSHDEKPLAQIKFTKRQSVSFSGLKFLLEEKIKGHELSFDEDWSAQTEYEKSLMKPLQDAQSAIEGKEQAVLFRLLNYLKPYQNELTVGVIGAFGATLTGLIPAFMSGKLIDEVIRPFQAGNLDSAGAFGTAWTYFGLFVLSLIGREFFMWMRLNKMSILGEKVAKDLRNDLYSHLQKLNLDFYSKKNTGSIISRVSSDTDRIWDFIAFGIVESSIAVLSLVCLSSVLIYLDWKLGMLMTIPVPILLFSIYRHGERMKSLFTKAWRKWSSVTGILSDTIPGIQVVKAFGQEKKELNKFSRSNVDVTNEFEKIHMAWTKFWPLLMLSIHSISIGVWFFAIPRLLTNGEHGLSAGTFISFLLYMTMFSAPIEVIGQVSRMLNRAISSAHRIFEILDTKPALKQKKNAKKVELQGKIDFEDVTFSYDGIRPILKKVSFEIKAGEMIGLVGKSGGGKSTISKLIARFYDANSGEIKVDGHNVKDFDLSHFRKQVGMVLQDPYLFQGPIWENIAYGVDEDKKNMSEIIKAAQAANAHDFICSLPQGYDTVIGERGHTLSGGERQRVSIARAILADPKILILDEATSAVDTETERHIQDALDNLIEGRTVIAIAHRLSTLRKANRIFVIGKGGIVESGSHRELINKEDGAYKKLHQMQQQMSESFIV
ncbi:MAG: ABC transporter ATP-binding protein [Oligoflexia bacterium]|nr:ABC transporter ATP-binding protein [Oligoflexia bacterium]